MRDLIGLAGVAAGGVVSGLLSVAMRNGGAAWLGPVTCILPMLSWTFLTRYGTLPVPLLVMLFEVTLCTATMLTLVATGYRPSTTQGLGLIIALVGLALLAKGH